MKFKSTFLTTKNTIHYESIQDNERCSYIF